MNEPYSSRFPPEDLPPPDKAGGGEDAAVKTGSDIEHAEAQRALADISNRKAVDVLTSWIVRLVLIAASIMAVSAVGILFWHYAASDRLTWLSPERFDRLEKFLLSGAMGALMSGSIQFYFSKKR